jgi:acetoin utilization protein AcuB
MTAGEIISANSYAVRPDDSIRLILDRMAEYKTAQLPVITDQVYTGVVDEEELFDFDSSAALRNTAATFRPVFVREEQHIYDALHLFSLHQTDIMPVLDRQNSYTGSIALPDLTNALATLTAVDVSGGIIVLEIGNRDNALSHIAKIVESANAQVLSSYVRAFPDSTKLEVTLKVNRSEISDIVAAFSRYDYTITHTYNDIRENDAARERYDQLMHYLNM